ncbi:MAG: four helix bundle protein [Candidatus Peribacteraceae bacterium]|jgi:four helix bundle protein|nr:four helix bundle protein [Candidatus Peribacteraceae bacterium]
MSDRLYQNLIVWKEAHKLCLCIYSVTKTYPSDERFGLVSQMRRSSSSIPTNIAEGNAKKSKKDRSRFFGISLGSLEELHYQCLLSRDLQFITQDTFNEITDNIQRTGYLLHKIRSSLL